VKVLEFEAKALLREHGLRVPRGQWVTSAEGAADAAAAMAGLIDGPVVIKAQVPTGGRMKAGGVRFADTPEQAQAIAGELLGLTIKGFAVQALLVEEKVPNTAELFVSLTYDSEARSAVLLASAAGGIEIEAETKLVRRPVPTLTAASEYIGREAAAELGLEGAAFLDFSAAVNRLAVNINSVNNNREDLIALGVNKCAL
jgi:succinyl-CoA synthetase beta subunit